jgi:hydroxymethylpyrimidine/phosphomethylpyrimidine kinase
MSEPAKVLTIAGSDSGGAAGLQADLKTFSALGVYGMSVITVVTAQNSVHVVATQPLPPPFVTQQLDAVLSDYGAQAVKTGFLGSAATISAVAARLRAYRPQHLVVDPVLVNHRGETMFAAAVTAAYRAHLLPLADLITPNGAEAGLLADRVVTSTADMAEAARTLHAAGPAHVLISGGREGNVMVDLFYDGRRPSLLRTPRIATENTHGSGDTLSAAVVALLARGLPMAEAVRRAHAFTARAIAGAAAWQLGAGHGPLNHLRGQEG